MIGVNEILYRGQTENGKWVEGFYVKINNKHFIYTGQGYIKRSQSIFDEDGEYVRQEPYTISTPERLEVIPETVGQYTGLKDINDKKIFKGQTLKYETLVGIIMFGHFYQSKCNEYDCTHYGWYVHTQYGEYNLGNQWHRWEIVDECKEV